MGFRYRKSIKVAPGVKVNVGKKSVGVSVGGKGFHTSVNSSGRRTTTASIPGTGMSYVKTSSIKTSSSKNKKTASTPVENQPVNDDYANAAADDPKYSYYYSDNQNQEPQKSKKKANDSNKNKKPGCLTIIIVILLLIVTLASCNSCMQDDTSGSEESTEISTEQTTETETIEGSLDAAGTVMYTTTTVNVRSAPGTDASVIAILAPGDEVNVLEDDGSWSKIETENGTAYIASDYLADSYTAPEEPKEQQAQTVAETPAAEEQPAQETPAVHEAEQQESSAPQETVVQETPAVQEQEPQVQEAQPSTDMVWVPQSGSKYHSNSSCSGMKNPRQISKEDAIAQGYEPCSKCY